MIKSTLNYEVFLYGQIRVKVLEVQFKIISALLLLQFMVGAGASALIHRLLSAGPISVGSDTTL